VGRADVAGVALGDGMGGLSEYDGVEEVVGSLVQSAEVAFFVVPSLTTWRQRHGTGLG